MGGSQSEEECIRGLKLEVASFGSSGGESMKNERRWRLRCNRCSDMSETLVMAFQRVVAKGVGMNLSPRPSKARRLAGGAMVVVKSWKARLVAR